MTSGDISTCLHGRLRTFGCRHCGVYPSEHASNFELIAVDQSKDEEPLEALKSLSADPRR